MSVDMSQQADLLTYQANQAEVARAFRELPRGSQAAASYDLRVSQSSISGVLTLRMVDPILLDRLRKWAEENFSLTIPSTTAPAAE